MLRKLSDERVPDQADRRFNVVVPKANEPEEVRCIGVFRAPGEELLVDRAGVIQTAGAMQLERLIQQCGIRRRR